MRPSGDIVANLGTCRLKQQLRIVDRMVGNMISMQSLAYAANIWPEPAFQIQSEGRAAQINAQKCQSQKLLTVIVDGCGQQR